MEIEVTEVNFEEWKRIPEFPDYSISNWGNVWNHHRDHIMQTSLTNFGHVKISLKSPRSRHRYTRSVAQLVAEAFILPPNALCNQVVVLDGNLSNIEAQNLVWRPVWFAWKYVRQLKTLQPRHYHNLPIFNLETGVRYESVIEAGMTEGLLFDDIWRSTYTGSPVYPYGVTFEVDPRV